MHSTAKCCDRPQTSQTPCASPNEVSRCYIVVLHTIRDNMLRCQHSQKIRACEGLSNAASSIQIGSLFILVKRVPIPWCSPPNWPAQQRRDEVQGHDESVWNHNLWGKRCRFRAFKKNEMFEITGSSLAACFWECGAWHCNEASGGALRVRITTRRQPCQASRSESHNEWINPGGLLILHGAQLGLFILNKDFGRSFANTS